METGDPDTQTLHETDVLDVPHPSIRTTQERCSGTAGAPPTARSRAPHGLATVRFRSVMIGRGTVRLDRRERDVVASSADPVHGFRKGMQETFCGRVLLEWTNGTAQIHRDTGSWDPGDLGSEGGWELRTTGSGEREVFQEKLRHSLESEGRIRHVLQVEGDTDPPKFIGFTVHDRTIITGVRDPGSG